MDSNSNKENLKEKLNEYSSMRDIEVDSNKLLNYKRMRIDNVSEISFGSTAKNISDKKKQLTKNKSKSKPSQIINEINNNTYINICKNEYSSLGNNNLSSNFNSADKLENINTFEIYTGDKFSVFNKQSQSELSLFSSKNISTKVEKNNTLTAFLNKNQNNCDFNSSCNSNLYNSNLNTSDKFNCNLSNYIKINNNSLIENSKSSMINTISSNKNARINDFFKLKNNEKSTGFKQPYCSNNESDEKMNLLVERLNNTNYKLRTEIESLKSTILDKDENIKKFICDIRVISDMLKANKTALINKLRENENLKRKQQKENLNRMSLRLSKPSEKFGSNYDYWFDGEDFNDIRSELIKIAKKKEYLEKTRNILNEKLNKLNIDSNDLQLQERGMLNT